MCVYICLTFNWKDNDDNVNSHNNNNNNNNNKIFISSCDDNVKRNH